MNSVDSATARLCVSSFIDHVLNAADRDQIERVASRQFVDHSPLPVPGSPGRSEGDLRYLYDLVEFLAQPTVDIAFSIEDMFAEGEKVACRIFGEGTITLNAEETTGPEHESLRARGNLLGRSMLHCRYNSVSIFRIDD